MIHPGKSMLKNEDGEGGAWNHVTVTVGICNAQDDHLRNGIFRIIQSFRNGIEGRSEPNIFYVIIS